MELSLEEVKALTDSDKIQEIFLKLREQEVIWQVYKFAVLSSAFESHSQNFRRLEDHLAQVMFNISLFTWFICVHDMMHGSGLSYQQVH